MIGKVIAVLVLVPIKLVECNRLPVDTNELSWPQNEMCF